MFGDNPPMQKWGFPMPSDFFQVSRTKTCSHVAAKFGRHLWLQDGWPRKQCIDIWETHLKKSRFDHQIWRSIHTSGFSMVSLKGETWGCSIVASRDERQRRAPFWQNSWAMLSTTVATANPPSTDETTIELLVKELPCYLVRGYGCSQNRKCPNL